MRAAKTNFEQIPLAQVKKIATKFHKGDEAGKNVVSSNEKLTCRASGRIVGQGGRENQTAMSTFDLRSDSLDYPEWQASLRAMLMELDREKLKARVAEAEAAIFQRQQTISDSDKHDAEKQAIKDALVILRDFKHLELGFPEW